MENLAKKIALLVLIFVLTGCAAPVDRFAEDVYCHRDHGRNPYCTKENVPSLSKDEEAKQFFSDPTAFTVYIVRYSGDGHHPLNVLINGATSIEMIPVSMIRLRLKPGSHRFSFTIAEEIFTKTVNGAAGDVKLLGVTGSDWVWGTGWFWGSSSHAWSNDTDEQVKRQARRSRLIKDASLL